MRTSRTRQSKPAAVRTHLRTGVTAALLPLTLTVSALVGTVAVAPAAAVAGAPAYLGIEAPSTAVSAGRHAVRVRLTAGGQPVAGATVRFERDTVRGWLSAGTVVTDVQGYSIGALPFSATMKLRAVSPGRAVSRETFVAVTQPPAARVGAAATARMSAAGGFRATAFRVALAQGGKPYRYGSAGPSSFDCSGLVQYAFRAAGKSVPRTSGAIRAATRPISRAAAVPGDLVVMPGHIGIYAGEGRMVDAPRPGRTVSLRTIWTDDYVVHRVL